MRWTIWLYPLSVIYDAVTRLRNHLYNIGSKPSFSFEANVIAVGNLSVGGTGKTPMVTYLIDHFLKKQQRIVTLSRGYGRKTRGFKWGDSNDTAKELGDEPLMYQERYRDQIKVAVGEERAWAIPQILADQPDTDVILLDDAYQHRTVIPTFSILLTTYQRPFYQDYVLPSGRLRESRRGVNRADLLIITKCPNKINTEQKSQIRKHIAKYAPHTPVFFTAVSYGSLVPLSQRASDSSQVDKVMAVAGIAHASDYFSYLSKTYHLINRVEYKDHHYYSLRQIQKLDLEAVENEAAIVLTEKDATKWKPYIEELTSQVYYLPIKVSFIDKEPEFLNLVDSSIKKYDRVY